ncbi:SDR family oxidoreductase [Lentzea sp. NPDC042327]|uniref:SDR family NAD(P)-dependent oxidoreductase n=1 Tax=Lentzea sp. NPDC042327 TaxID=3154801 RepID=UPI0033C2CE73
MTTASEMKGRHALVTGGSSGIGEAIADALAGHGANLVLVARDPDRLEKTAAGLRERHSVVVRCVPLDLDEPGAPHRLLEVVREAGVEVEMLVNNAGTSSRALVADSDPAALRRLVDLNAGALTELTALVVAGMVRRGRGSVVNIASTGAYTPAPVLAAYAASKAYVLSFTQALWAETRSSGVRVVAVSPGPTRTAMNARPGRGKRDPAQVARTALAALERRGPAVVDGHLNKLTAFLLRRTPLRLVAALALRATQP